MKNMKKAQSIVEYLLFIGVIAMAFSLMQVYGKRGLQAVVKSQADTLGGQQDNQMSLNDTQVSWFKQRYGDTGQNAPVTTGKNNMVSGSSVTVKAGKYSGSEVSTTTTSFSGASVGGIEPNDDATSEYCRANPDKCQQ
jgi:hypothetical protein